MDNLGEPLARNLRWGWGNDAFNKIGNFTNQPHSLANLGVKRNGLGWFRRYLLSCSIRQREALFKSGWNTKKVVKGLAAVYAYSDKFNYTFDNLDTIHITDTKKSMPVL